MSEIRTLKELIEKIVLLPDMKDNSPKLIIKNAQDGFCISDIYLRGDNKVMIELSKYSKEF